MKKQRINVAFTEDEYNSLLFMSRKRKQSLSSLVRYLTNDCMEEEEEETLAKLIEERKNDRLLSSEETWADFCTE